MKYMILTNASHQDYDAMAGQASSEPGGRFFAIADFPPTS
jgi:hypothetical protein